MKITDLAEYPDRIEIYRGAHCKTYPAKGKYLNWLHCARLACAGRLRSAYLNNSMAWYKYKY